jgi:hypothetical protein
MELRIIHMKLEILEKYRGKNKLIDKSLAVHEEKIAGRMCLKVGGNRIQWELICWCRYYTM